MVDVFVDGDYTYSAKFTQKIFNVNLTAAPSDGGSVSGEGQYYYNNVVQVNATPNNGYTFLHWEDLSGNTVSTQASFYLTVVSDTTLYAIFGAQNTGIASVKDNINIYPNPASSILNITGKDIEITSIVITNILGKEEPVKLIRSDADRVSLSVKGLSPGIYLLKILTSSGRYINKRLIIK